MVFRRNLFRKGKKSVFRIILGLLFLIISFAWIEVRIIEHHGITPFDWIYTVFMTINGIVHTVEGLGFSFASLTGLAFIEIDEDRILIKKSAFSKDQVIFWDDIKTIDYKLIRFRIVLKNEESLILDFSKLEYSLVKDIKEAININANEKGIFILA